MPDPLLYDPINNPGGDTLENVLERLIAEVRLKQGRAADAGITAGARESALVVTNLEQALLWQFRRGMVTGVVDVVIAPMPTSGAPS